MKRIQPPFPITVLALTFLPAFLFAAEPSGRWEARESTEAAIADLYPHGQRASDVIGLPLQGPAGESLGRISDLIVDVRSGDIVFGVVSTGGLLGIGDTLRAVPFGALRYASPNRAGLHLEIDESRWVSAPRYNPDELSLLAREDRARELYDYYDQAWEPASNSAVGTSDALSERRLTPASWLKGREVRSGENAIGRIDDLIVDVEEQRASFLLNPEDSLTGTTASYVVPFSHLVTSQADPDVLNTTVATSDLREAKVMDGKQWTRAGNAAVYRWGGATTSETESSSRDDYRVSSSPSRTETPAPLESVRRAIQTDDTLQSSAHNIDVLAQNNRLVLRGTVPTAELKERVEDKAEEAAYGWRIDNQLRVDGQK